MLRLLALFALFAASSAFAATATSYDGRFTLDVPSGLTVTDPAAFSQAPVPRRPYIALERKGKPLPVLLVMPGGEGDAKAFAAQELDVFKKHNAKDPSVHPSKAVRLALLKSGAKAYWFSNGKKDMDYSWIYVGFEGSVLKAGCPSIDRTVCQGILNTIKPVHKP